MDLIELSIYSCTHYPPLAGKVYVPPRIASQLSEGHGVGKTWSKLRIPNGRIGLKKKKKSKKSYQVDPLKVKDTTNLIESGCLLDTFVVVLVQGSEGNYCGMLVTNIPVIIAWQF